MKTITFYSYKGGVGRSLALSNIAIRLSELNKKVCLLDFDLEAPGLPFKFKNYKRPIIQKGIVDYIYNFSCGSPVHEKIKDYSYILNPRNKNFQPIQLIPAGNIEDNEYWKKLSNINWSDMFYSENGNGVKFILDLKAKIQLELSPDFLLVDSRTGITDISGITLRLLADEVVILASYNEENLFGSKKIIKSLLDTSNSLFEKSPKINFILTRLPLKEEEKAKEDQIIERIKNEFKFYLGIKEFDFSIIHSEQKLEINEGQLIGYEYEEKRVSISNDYLKLFDKLTSDILSPKEIELFYNKKRAEKEYNLSLNEIDNVIKIKHLNKAIELDNSKHEFYVQRGYVWGIMKEWQKSIQDYQEALKLFPNNELVLNNLGVGYNNLEKIDTSIECYKKAIELNQHFILAYSNLAGVLLKRDKPNEALLVLNKAIENNSNVDSLLNSRADLYRQIEDYKKAYDDIYKAIEINSKEPVYFGTLAEIFACDGKTDEFYFNLNIALGMGLKAKNMNTAKAAYEKFKNDEKFIALMNKNYIDVDDIFIDEE